MMKKGPGGSSPALNKGRWAVPSRPGPGPGRWRQLRKNGGAFALLAAALLCISAYPLFFLRTPDDSGGGAAAFFPPRARLGPHPATRSPGGAADAGAALRWADAYLAEPGGTDEAAEDGAEEALKKEEEASEHGARGGAREDFPSAEQEGGKSTAAPPAERGRPPSSGSRRSAGRRGSSRDKGKGRSAAAARAKQGPAEDAEEEYGDEAEEELEEAQQAEAEGPQCRCEGAAARDCDGALAYHRAVSAVCAIAPDIRGVYSYHRWRLSHRLERRDFQDRVRAIAATYAGADGALDKQRSEVAAKLARNRGFRAQLVQKMRDSYGRRFQLPRPFDVFNEALQDQEEFEDRDQEDAYLSVLAATVLSAVRDSMHDQEFMRADRVFYSLENHERLREGHDPIRNETLPFLPPESPRLRYGTCAVVGNSGNLLEGGGLGKDIDAHDAVIRTNQAPTWKYEDFVGSRTDVRVLNKRWTDELGRRHIDLLKNDASGMVAISSRENVRQFTLFARALQKALPQATPLFLSTRVVTGAMRFLRLFRKGITAGLPRTIRGGNTASSGILALFLAIQFCEKVDVYGFSMEECRTDGCSRGYHYFRGIADSPFLRAHPSHSFEIEGLVLRAMHALGVACLYPSPVITGECGSRLGGLIGDAGKWSRGSGTQAPRDLWDAMAWLKLSNVTSLRHRIEEYKALHAAAIAAAAAERAQDQEVEGQAEHRGGEAMIADEHDADGIVSRMEQV